MSPKRILNVDLSYLLNNAEVFIDFRKYELVSNFRLNRLVYEGGLTDKF